MCPKKTLLYMYLDKNLSAKSCRPSHVSNIKTFFYSLYKKISTRQNELTLAAHTKYVQITYTCSIPSMCPFGGHLDRSTTSSSSDSLQILSPKLVVKLHELRYVLFDIPVGYRPSRT